MRKPLWGVLAVVAIVALGVSGCATKTYVREEVAKASQATDAKIGEVQKVVETNQQDIANLQKSDQDQNEQLAKLSDAAKEALARAQEAGKLAKGKFVFEQTLTDNDARFGFNQATLSNEAKAALDAFAAKVKEMNKNVYIEIQGHTDNLGSEEYNFKLGQWRADAAMRYLAMHDGIPLFRMSAISYGESKPVASNKTRDGRAENRRVTLVVLE